MAREQQLAARYELRRPRPGAAVRARTHPGRRGEARAAALEKAPAATTAARGGRHGDRSPKVADSPGSGSAGPLNLKLMCLVRVRPGFQLPFMFHSKKSFSRPTLQIRDL